MPWYSLHQYANSLGRAPVILPVVIQSGLSSQRGYARLEKLFLCAAANRCCCPKADNSGGSNGACMRMSPEKDWGANAGLEIARDFIEGGRLKTTGNKVLFVRHRLATPKRLEPGISEYVVDLRAKGFDPVRASSRGCCYTDARAVLRSYIGSRAAVVCLPYHSAPRFM